jgi:hypothetical protein
MEDEGHQKKKEKESQATLLVKLATERCQMCRDEQGEGYVKIKMGDHSEFQKVRSAAFRKWMRYEFLTREGKTPSSQALQDAIEHVEAICDLSGSSVMPRIRIGEFSESFYLDIGAQDWMPIVINEDGWKPTFLMHGSSVSFVRPKGFLPLPVPKLGGDIEQLRDFLNVGSADDFILVVSWLLKALEPNGPFPVLVITGEQGSAKSSMAKILKTLIDPSAAIFRSYPREERDLVIAAANSWILTFDNMSGLPAWLSDGLCRISTGGGFSTRQLYSDRDEVIFNDTRPMILNGISDIVARHDLIDRCLFITLPPIPDSKRKSEKELNEAFAKAHPYILGSLLTAVCAGIQNRSNVVLERRPRMADFAEWVCACEPMLPWKEGSFIWAYDTNRATIHKAALENDLFASSLLEWFKDQKKWEGKASELLQAVEDDISNYEEKKADKIRRIRGWPTDATRTSAKLRKLSGFLRRVGLEVEFPDRTKKGRKLVIRRIYENSVTSVTSVIPEEKQASSGDAEGDAEKPGDAELFSSVIKKPNDFKEGDANDTDDAESEFLSDDDGIPF